MSIARVVALTALAGACIAVACATPDRNPAAPNTSDAHAARTARVRPDAPPPPSDCVTRGPGDTIISSPCPYQPINEPAHTSGIHETVSFANDDAGGGVMSVTCSGSVISCSISPRTDLNGFGTVTFATGAAGTGNVIAADRDTVYRVTGHAGYVVTAK